MPDHADQTIPYQKKSPEDYYQLGLNYYNCSQEDAGAEVVRYFELAANKGHRLAQRHLGEIYEFGWLGNEPDDQQAEKWYLIATRSGDDIAPHNLSVIYQYGFGSIEKNSQKAFYFCRLSTERGCILALNNLGAFYETGFGAKKNLKKAKTYYSMAIAKEEPYAQYNLAKLYDEATQDQETVTRVIDLYFKAAKQGVIEAKERLIFLAKMHPEAQAALTSLPCKQRRKRHIISLSEGLSTIARTGSEVLKQDQNKETHRFFSNRHSKSSTPSTPKNPDDVRISSEPKSCVVSRSSKLRDDITAISESDSFVKCVK